MSWNVEDLLRRCLRSLPLDRMSTRIDVVVIDNASTDGTASMVRREFPGVDLVASHTNLGFTGGNNLGLRRLGICADGVEAPPYAVLLNPDTEVFGTALDTLAAYLDEHPEVGAAGPELNYPDGAPQSSCRRFPTVATGLMESTPLEWHWRDNPASRRYRMADIRLDAARPVDWLTGAALALRTDALEEVGLFDERFFMYSEELDLCRRLGNSGWEVHFVPQARILHHEGASSDQVVAFRHRRFHLSRALYFQKHHSAGAALLVRLGVAAQFAFEILLEAAKGLAGRNRQLRRERVAAYIEVIGALLHPNADGKGMSR